MKLNPVEEVLKFHEAMSLTVGDFKNAMTNEDVDLRIRLIAEEVAETVHALTAPDYNLDTKLAVLDGLCDIVYVSAGTVVTRGVLNVNKTYIETFKIDRAHVIDLNRQLFLSNLAKELLSSSQETCDVIRSEGRKQGVEAAGLIITNCTILNYTCEQVAEILKLPLEAAFTEVQNSNMSKRLKDGTVFHDKGGKVRKPPGWIGPDLKYVLETGSPIKRDLFTTPDSNEWPDANSIADANGWLKIQQ